MNKETSDLTRRQDAFFDLLKRTYEKGINDNEITVERLVEEIKVDIQKVMAR